MKYQLQLLEIERHHKPSDSGVNRKIKNITKKIIGYFYSKYPQQVGDIIRYNEKDNGESKDYTITKIIHITKQEDEIECVLEVETHYDTKLYSYGSHAWVEHIPLVIDVNNFKV